VQVREMSASSGAPNCACFQAEGTSRTRAKWALKLFRRRLNCAPFISHSRTNEACLVLRWRDAPLQTTRRPSRPPAIVGTGRLQAARTALTRHHEVSDHRSIQHTNPVLDVMSIRPVGAVASQHWMPLRTTKDCALNKHPSMRPCDCCPRRASPPSLPAEPKARRTGSFGMWFERGGVEASAMPAPRPRRSPRHAFASLTFA
jgi:hypothetical protein